MTRPADGTSTAEAVCFRHPNRPTNVRCQNCDKPICPDCMRDSPVGYRCPDCAPQRSFVIADDLLVTKTIIALCVGVYVLGFVLSLVDGAGANPMSGSSKLNTNFGLITYAIDPTFGPGGVVTGANVIGVAGGEFWRLFTSGFLHAGLLHIAFNMFFIWSFGQLLEPALGRFRYAMLYVIGLLGGSIGAMLMSPVNVVTVGASGAGFALLGAALVWARLRGHQSLQTNLIFLAVINLAISFAPGSGISVGGHIGGFIAGLVFGWVAFGPLARQRQLVTLVFAFAIVALFLSGIAVADFKAPAG